MESSLSEYILPFGRVWPLPAKEFDCPNSGREENLEFLDHPFYGAHYGYASPESASRNSGWRTLLSAQRPSLYAGVGGCILRSTRLTNESFYGRTMHRYRYPCA